MYSNGGNERQFQGIHIRGGESNCKCQIYPGWVPISQCRKSWLAYATSTAYKSLSKYWLTVCATKPPTLNTVSHLVPSVIKYSDVYKMFSRLHHLPSTPTTLNTVPCCAKVLPAHCQNRIYPHFTSTEI